VATLKKYNLTGQEIGNVAVQDNFINVEANQQMIKDYIVALRANARQWSANTKGRSEVSHSTKKPHRQKGTGSARQGSLAAPQYKGGGIVFGPKPKFDQHVRINRKERRLAIRFLLSEKIKSNQLIVLPDDAVIGEGENAPFAKPKTKIVANFLNTLQYSGRRVLFIGKSAFEEVELAGFKARFHISSNQHEGFVQSMRNIPRVEFRLASNLNGYDVLLARYIVVTESALEELQELLS
jgi:large subunit ribosomal protein L4